MRQLLAGLIVALGVTESGASQTSGLGGDAVVTTVALSEPLPGTGRLGGVAIDADGLVYVANFREAVWRVGPDGTVTLLSRELRGSSGNAVMPDGSLLQAGFLDNRIIRIGRDGTTHPFAEGFNGPVGIAVDTDGTVYVCNCRGNSISKVAPDGTVSVFAASDLLDCPNGVVIDRDGELVVTSFNTDFLTRIDEAGAVRRWLTVAEGNNAHLARIGDDFFVTKIATNTIYRVTRSGAVSRFAGTGEEGLTDGPVGSATLARPNGIAAAPGGDALVVNNLDGEWRGEVETQVVLRRIAPPRAPRPLERLALRVGGLTFDALAAGPADGELVLLLHGFPQTGYAFRHQLRALAAAGYRAVAPDQRGYSPGARPAEVEAYAMGRLVEDVIGMADALGRPRFHLVGHDWGGAVAWVVAARHPSRLASLTVLSTPHYAALGAGLADTSSEQAERSAYFDDFAAPGAEARFLADDQAYFRGLFDGSGITAGDLEVYLDRLGTPEAMGAALNWYRALVAARSSPPPSASPASPAVAPIRVPTLYVWGTEDRAFARASAERTAEFVSEPYAFFALSGRGHWLPEAAADTVTALLLAHLRQNVSTSSQSLDDYRRARRAIERAARELGAAAPGGFENIEGHYRGFELARGQSHHPGPPYDTTAVRGRFLYDAAGRMRHDERIVNRGGTDRSFSRVVTDSGGWNLWIARRLLTPLTPQDVQFLRASPNLYAPRSLPHSLVAEALSNPASWRWLGARSENGRRIEWVSFATAEGVVVNLGIDAADGRPVRAERLGVDTRRGDVVRGVRFGDYRRVAGLAVPHRLDFALDDMVVGTRWLDSVTVNRTIADRAFAEPDGEQMIELPPLYRPTEVAPGVFVARLYSGPANSYNTAFVLFEDFVVVFEAPLVDAFFPVYQAVAQRIAPGKPIRYVVTTHHHADHVGGVRPFLRAGVEVVAPPAAVRVIERMAAAEPTIQPNPLAGVDVSGRIVSVADSMVISDGKRSLRIRQVGPTPHVEQILIADLPDDGIVFVADLFAIPDNRVFPPASPTFRFFADLVRGRGLDVRIIVPVHGVVGTAADLERALGS